MKKLLFLTIILGILLCSYASAQTIKARGIGSVTYSETVTKKKPKGASGASVQDRENALQKAKLNAIERYFAERGEAETENYLRMEDRINDNLDRIILSDTILNEQNESGKYTVTVSVEINEARLRTIMRGESAVGSARKSQKSDIVYLFMGREVDSVRKSGPTVTTETSSKTTAGARTVGNDTVRLTGSQTGTTTESMDTLRSVTEGRVWTEGKEDRRATELQINTTADRTGTLETNTKATTSSDAVHRRDQLAYRLLSMSNYDSAITSVFSQAGFSVVDSRFVLSNRDLASVNNDYEQGDDIRAVTLNSVASTLRENGIPYLVLATLDVDPPTIDSATGLQRVVVRTAVRVLDINAMFPREVASVPAYQITGLGATGTEAQNRALSDSSQRATREIVQRLNALELQ